jgi:hypothetical protein
MASRSHALAAPANLRHSAEVILVDHGQVEPELAYPFLSMLEDRWLFGTDPEGRVHRRRAPRVAEEENAIEKPDRRSGRRIRG